MRALAVFLLFACTTSAHAFDGKYAGQFDQTMVVKQKPNGSYSLSLNIVADGCVGEVTASGKAKGTSLTAVAKVDGEVCKLTIRKTARGVSVSEGDGCLFLHGAGCTFSGQYALK